MVGGMGEALEGGGVRSETGEQHGYGGATFRAVVALAFTGTYA